MKPNLTSVCLTFSFFFVLNPSFSQTTSFDLLAANFGTGKTIEWETSGWGSGFGHKIYNSDPGGYTLLNFAVRHNTSAWTDAMTLTSQGRVGIGTAAPQTQLHLIGTTHGGQLFLQFTPSSPKLGIRAYADTYGDSQMLFYTNDLSTYPLALNGDKVGIGTRMPTEKLDVVGNAQVAGSIGTKKSSYTKIQLATYDWSGSHALLFNAYKDITVSGSLGTTGNTKFANNQGSYSGGAGGIFFYSNGGTLDFNISPLAGASGANTNIDWGTPKMRINRSGEVGIGTTDIDGYKLSVAGSIRAEEIKVEASPWPDYVFEPGYNLRSLEEIEAFIQSEKHLPGIPSAKEMEANGLELGEMNRLLLKKIEELTLYVLELKNKNEAQDKLIEQLLYEKK